MGGISREQELWASPNMPQQTTAEEQGEDTWLQVGRQRPKPNKKEKQVLLEGYVGEPTSEDDLKRTKSLTGEDLEELKGCLDLGFGFSYDEIPELCNTLPALQLCYSMTHKSNSASPIANWKISSPGDHPDDVKARLKYWAQAVACTVRLCS